MKIYRLDCSGNFRLVFQIKNPKLFTSIREWYKYKRRLNRLTRNEISIMYDLVEDEIERVGKYIYDEKLDFNSTSVGYLNILQNIYNKIL